MRRTVGLLTALVLWATGCSDQPLSPEIELAPVLASSVIATANGITISSIEGPMDPVAVNTPVQITVHFAGASGDTHTGLIRWGDGASAVATISGTDGAGTATATRSYVLPGVYTVGVEIINQSAESVLGTHEYVTVYDPDGGYVSGNGSILSPPNACTWSGCVADEGAARFGFSSRYRNGATVPDGNTRFTFRDGNFTFSSTAYEWLVIAGARAQYKGVGTVNREGNYGFMLTAIDSDRPGGGQEDRFRIKIWDREDGDAVVYDNQAGAGDDADLTADGTRLTRGSITIRSTVRNEAPVVIITSPADGAIVLETEGILLSADAGDAENGDLSASVVWSSDLAGELGVGAELLDLSLEPGIHTITAHVTDSGGLEASASVAVQIAEVTISVSPTTASISEGEAQQFTATVYADGVEMLSGAPTVAWSSSDESIATMGVEGVASGVSPGEATITAQVDGVNGDASLTVEEAPAVAEILAETISAGKSHSCGLTASGEAACWGNWWYGKLGHAGGTIWVQMPEGVKFASIVAGYDHTLALSTTGQAYAWGKNTYGQLGDGSTAERHWPVAVVMPQGISFVAITAHDVSMAIAATGDAYAWGWNGGGGLGDGTTTDRHIPTKVVMPEGVSFSTISTGGHTIALTTTGAAYAWGSNYHGELGDGSSTSRITPTAVAMPAGVSFKSVKTMGSGTVALSTTGLAFAWGNNNKGQLGNGSTVSQNTPSAVTMPAGVIFEAVDGGRNFAAALTTTGAAYAWGWNHYGHLGNGTTLDSHTPVQVAMPVGVTFSVLGGISASSLHVMALSATGVAWGWGTNYAYELGYAPNEPQTEPVLVHGGEVFAY